MAEAAQAKPRETLEQLLGARERLATALGRLEVALKPIAGAEDQAQAFRLYYWPLRRMAEQVESMLRTARRFQPGPPDPTVKP